MAGADVGVKGGKRRAYMMPVGVGDRCVAVTEPGLTTGRGPDAHPYDAENAVGVRNREGAGVKLYVARKIRVLWPTDAGRISRGRDKRGRAELVEEDKLVCTVPA